jgi:uncharacterized protein YcaQ
MSSRVVDEKAFDFSALRNLNRSKGVKRKLTLDDLRRLAVGQSLFAPTTLRRALERMGFVQADPIRAPARAQDLILRHRVKGYRAGDLERHYESLGVEEDFFINYGYVTRTLQTLMHPRKGLKTQGGVRKREKMLLDFVARRGVVHPREAEEHFEHGKVENYWGGSSLATTQMLGELHYRGMLGVARREKGIRLYAIHRHESPELSEAERRARIDLLVDVLVNIYAPLPDTSLSYYVRRLRYAVPQWEKEITAALRRARERLAHARVEGVEWYWLSNPPSPMFRGDIPVVRLVAPFDPVVHDRTRFQILWGWVYRFEAYIPAAKRKLGYYALPLLWRDRVIGWGNLAVKNGQLISDIGYVAGQPPRDRAFKRELEAELERMRLFLGAKS